MTRPWVLLGVSLALTLTLLGAWWFADRSQASARAREAEQGSVARMQTRARAPGRDRAGTLAAGEIPTPQIGAVVVAAEHGPLSFGAVELWCEDGRLGARAQLDEDGGFMAPACASTTCVRLRHPSFEQPRAWELAPGQARELEVAPAPGLRGVVVGPQASPIADASLLLQADDGRRAGARSDATGEFAVALAGLRPCDACDLEPGPSICRATGRDIDRVHARLLVSAPELAPTEVEVALELDAEAEPALELRLQPPAAPITGVVRGADGELFDARTKVLATNIEREAEQHHARVQAGRFELRGLADARYRLRAVRDGRELATLEHAAPGDDVELRAEQPARALGLALEIIDASAQPVPGVRVDGGPFFAAVSDQEGRVEAHDVGAGSYTLGLRAAECAVLRVVVEVPPDRDRGVHQILRLPPSCDPL